MVTGASLLQRIDKTHVPMIVARLVLGLVFIYYGLYKIAHPIEFLEVLGKYRLFPQSLPTLMNLTAVVLPWVEVLCGLLVIVGWRTRATVLLVLLLTLAFTAAVTIRALHIYGEGGTALCDIRFECGCGPGPIVFCSKVLENSGLLVLAVIGALSSSRKLSLDGIRGRRAAPAG
ncbi:MAG: MauE/DoxX family redox-associated membrane protein [Planctomycetota bacterium]